MAGSAAYQRGARQDRGAAAGDRQRDPEHCSARWAARHRDDHRQRRRPGGDQGRQSAGRALPAGRDPRCIRGRPGRGAGPRALKPALKIVARAHSDAEIEHLMKHGATEVVMGEHEIAKAMIAGHPRPDGLMPRRADGICRPDCGFVVAAASRCQYGNWAGSDDAISRRDQSFAAAGLAAGAVRHPVEPGRAAVRRPVAAVFLVVGMLAGESGPGGIVFDDVEMAYTVGSVALGLILFDGGLRTRFQTFRSVLGPAGTLVDGRRLVTAALIAPAAVLTLGMSWPRRCWSARWWPRPTPPPCSSCCTPRACGCGRASTRRWRSNPALNDPVAIFLTIVLVEYPAARQQDVERHRHAAGARIRARRPDRYCRRPADGAGAQPARLAAGPARAVRRDRRRRDLRRYPVGRTARAFSRSILPASWSATARPARTTRW